eukprot:13065738-Ditylum_brightwellii.AAC.1
MRPSSVTHTPFQTSTTSFGRCRGSRMQRALTSTEVTTTSRWTSLPNTYAPSSCRGASTSMSAFRRA